ncbi:hypothetical protein LTR10_018916 [Elasticomyces elasticus]|nr:hypothetical protein LTR10_018916 [Elasticomyces elasticus]KAK5034439.1 hypothetical protein LTS07_003360 [Exophiala sideris]KAK5042736.1 hypothetical protein LTR13_001584 [Exophiala sideris]KAK5185720.1 hypothetical protein LTR44_001769 [Eurotiomycetes sp. CCFEE 6388]
MTGNNVRTRIRKVKCDEAEPCCKRCTSTGRKCDGYFKPQDDNLSLESNRLTTNGSSGDEDRAFAFFGQMAGPALSGHSESYFWTNVVMQLSHREPAVRHAVVAVSSLYEKFQDVVKTPISAPANPLALRHYNAAIKELRSTRDETVVLVVCALFICIEFLQGNHQSAIEHCRSGILVLNKADTSFIRNSDSYRLGELRHTTIPTWIREKQDSLVISLNEWRCAFSEFRTSNIDLLTCCLLQMKFLVVQIWVNVALDKSEMVYDQHIDKFQSIIDLASQASLSRSQAPRPRPSFIFDMGFTPLLYFVAMKCRNLSIRLAALSFMTTLGIARETLWDLNTMYRVARRLIEIEHGIDLNSLQNPFPRHMVPEESRVKEVMLDEMEIRRNETGSKQLWAQMHPVLWRPVDELVTKSEWIALS